MLVVLEVRTTLRDDQDPVLPEEVGEKKQPRRRPWTAAAVALLWHFIANPPLWGIALGLLISLSISAGCGNAVQVPPMLDNFLQWCSSIVIPLSALSVGILHLPPHARTFAAALGYAREPPGPQNADNAAGCFGVRAGARH